MDRKIKRGEVYYCKLDGKGSVQDGVRPCIIVSNNKNNEHANIVMVVPVTTAHKHDIPTHVKVKIKRDSTVLCEQITTIEKSRVFEKLGYINNMNRIDKAIEIALGI